MRSKQVEFEASLAAAKPRSINQTRRREQPLCVKV
jgi:hypothetical protein